MTRKLATVKTGINSKRDTSTRNGTKRAATSGIAAKPADRMPDRRVRRTRDALGDALIELMREKPFKRITVQQVLDRAQVGRATFYAHFRDKDDLFLSDAEDFFSHVAQLPMRSPASRRIAAIAELFDHVAESQEFISALAASGRLHDVMEIGQECFARGIEKKLAAIGPEMPATRRRALSQALAGAMLALMRWWIVTVPRQPAPAMDELFHSLAWNGVGSK